MKLLLNNFRCFTGNPTEFNFEDGKLILLKGQSGTGKSTILEAIKWCLYGNIRGIYPSGFTPSYGGDIIGKSKTYITLEFSDFSITRSQAPEQLRVSRVDNELVQESAQHYIESIFGNKNVWLASSFVKQNEKCPLMTASNTERMSLLNEILFGSDIVNDFENPDFYVEKIDINLEVLDKEIISQTAIFNNYYLKYVESLKNFTNPYAWSVMNTDKIQEIQSNLEKIKIENSTLTLSLLEITRLEEKRRILLERIEGFKIRDASNLDLNKVKDEEIEKMHKHKSLEEETLKLKSDLQRYISNQTRFTSLYQELTDLKVRLEKHPKENISSEELSKEITELKKNLSVVQTNEINQIQLQRQLDTLNEEVLSLEKGLSMYENRDIEGLKEIIKNSELYIQLQNLHSKISQIGAIDSLLEESQIRTERERLTNSLHKARYNEAIFAKYGLNHTNLGDELNKSIEMLNFHETQKEHLERYKTFKNLKSQEEELIKKLIPSSETYSEAEIDEKIRLIESRLGTPLRCPHCSCNLEYKDNTLVIPESEIISKEDGLKEIARLKQVKNIIIFNKDIEQKLVSIKTSLSLISFDEEIIAKTVLSNTDFVRLQGMIRECATIDGSVMEESGVLDSKLLMLNRMENYHKLSGEYKTESLKFNSNVPVKTDLTPIREAINTIPVLENNLNRCRNSLIDVKNKFDSIIITTSSKEINQMLQERQSKYDSVTTYEKLMSNFSKIETELSKIELKDTGLIETSIKSNEELILRLNSEINSLREDKNRLEEYINLQSQLEQIKIERPSTEIFILLERNRQTQEDLLNQISQATYMLNLLESKTELETLQKQLIVMTNKQAGLNKMKALILDVTNSALQDLVDNINNTANNILEELFETGLSIELKLYKELKGKQSGAKSKPYVNLSVYQNGHSYELTAMSGGEASRISLALTIALAVIHPTPFVMLDEVMASLDMNLRENCIDVMRKYLVENESSRCVIDVEHLFIEAYYDTIIPLGCC